MWIVLNPLKAHRFTTKGINLHANSPFAFVPPDLEPEFKNVIDKAIEEQILFVTEKKEFEAMIPKQGQIGIIESDTDESYWNKIPRDGSIACRKEEESELSQLSEIVESELESN